MPHKLETKAVVETMKAKQGPNMVLVISPSQCNASGESATIQSGGVVWSRNAVSKQICCRIKFHCSLHEEVSKQNQKRMHFGRFIYLFMVKLAVQQEDSTNSAAPLPRVLFSCGAFNAFDFVAFGFLRDRFRLGMD